MDGINKTLTPDEVSVEQADKKIRGRKTTPNNDGDVGMNDINIFR